MKIPTIFVTDVEGDRTMVCTKALTNAMRAVLGIERKESKTPSPQDECMKCTAYVFLPDLLLALKMANSFGVAAFPVSVFEFRGGEETNEDNRDDDPPNPGGS